MRCIKVLGNAEKGKRGTLQRKWMKIAITMLSLQDTCINNINTRTHTHTNIYTYMQPVSLCFTLFENTLKILIIKLLISIKLLIANKMIRSKS
jgi:hypothetical protein